MNDPRRFDRERYLADKSAYLANLTGPKPDKEKYWIKIQNRNLNCFADISYNMTLTYVTSADVPVDAAAVQDVVKSALGAVRKDLKNHKGTMQPKIDLDSGNYLRDSAVQQKVLRDEVRDNRKVGKF